MVGWLMGDADARAAMLTELLACFLTGKGELRADFAGDKGRMTDCVGSAARIADAVQGLLGTRAAMHVRSEEHTSELQSLMRISYAVFCLKKKKNTTTGHQP